MPTSVSIPFDSLKTRVMSGVVNRNDRSHRFLTDLMFPRATWLPIENDEVQIDEMYFTPTMAPFVSVNDEPVMMDRSSGKAYSVKTPLISLMEPLTAGKILLQRYAGETDLLTSNRNGAMRRRLNRQISKDIALMETSISEREEWMVAQVLRGSITYSAPNRANFSITFAKPAGNTIVPAVFWDAASPTFHQDIQAVKRQQSANRGPALTDAICSTEAAIAIEAAIESDKLKLSNQRNVEVGNFSAFVNQFAEDSGVIYLGNLNGIRFWEYGESVLEEDGTTAEALIRPGYIEFVSVGAMARRMSTMYYGVIEEMEAIKNNVHVARRYATSDITKRPSQLVQQQMSRPLPIFKRPDWNISFQAVSV